MIDVFEYTNCIEILRISLKLSQDELCTAWDMLHLQDRERYCYWPAWRKWILVKLNRL